jgi:hypothetical protein
VKRFGATQRRLRVSDIFSADHFLELCLVKQAGRLFARTAENQASMATPNSGSRS